MRAVSLLRPYPPARTLRAMARSRWGEAVCCLFRGDVAGWSRLRKDADRIEEEASRAARWESDCELALQAAQRILDRAGR